MSSLRDHLQACGQDELLAQLRRLAPVSYEEFVSTLYEDLDQLIGLVEADAKDFQDASEDELNRELVRLLNARFYAASHDHDEGGHVDVRVRSRDGRFSWLAEAKLDNGPAYLSKGVDQLTERYVRGTPGHHCGGFLVYVQKARCAERFATWRQHLAANASSFEDLTVEDCKSRQGLAFYSEFVLPRLGTGVPKYRIRHIAVTAFREANAP
ncbi:hypothetical protein [Roseateles aquatilis]|uniref:hypothetical protein n=1 Tax=Roseateles aquatilis TaxID=431061 RepID=UPI001131E02A|nr:hypothetical protein [Roseateles aquatilis]